MRPEPLPIDVERVGVGRKLAPFEHGQPPRVVGPADAHVVWHDVEQQSQAVRLDGRREALEARQATEFGIDLGRVDGVVTMRRSRPRFQDWGGIDVADAEFGDERQDFRRIGEGEALVELQPVGRSRRCVDGARRGSQRAALVEHGGTCRGERAARRE